MHELTADEIYPNLVYEGGSHITDPDLKKFSALVQQDVETNLQISANPDSVLVLSGLDSNLQAKISLPVGLDQTQIYSTTASQYSADDFLDNKFAPEFSTLITRRLEEKYNSHLSL
jgi:hypothetical protein